MSTINKKYTNDNCKRGREFEDLIEQELRSKNIPFLAQVKLNTCITKPDFVLFTSNGGVIHIAAKKSLRERYLQVVPETINLMATLSKNTQSYIFTQDSRKAITRKNGLILKDVSLRPYISEIIHINDLCTFLSLRKFVSPTSKKLLNVVSYNEERSNIL